jgi:hypothetical protein
MSPMNNYAGFRPPSEKPGTVQQGIPMRSQPWSQQARSRLPHFSTVILRRRQNTTIRPPGSSWKSTVSGSTTWNEVPARR